MVRKTITQQLRESIITAKPIAVLYLLCLGAILFLFLRSVEVPMLGAHPWRQADTLFTGYFFCQEDANILHPRVAQRRDTTGIAIGEFPIYSWIISLPCQATGEWSEVTPKLISFALYVATSLLFGVAISNRFRGRFNAIEGALVMLMGTLAVTYLPKTFPDGLALFFFVLAGHLWSQNGPPRLVSIRNAFAMALVVLGFLIRPYMIPIIFLFIPYGIFGSAIMIGLVFMAYKAWFVDWTQTSTFQYYFVHRKPLLEALAEAPQAIGPLFSQSAKDHLNYILIPSFVMGALRRPWLFLLWISSFVLVILVSGDHFGIHSYYLFATFIFAIVLALWGLPTRSPTLKRFVLFLFAAIGFSNTQHFFHRPNDEEWKNTRALVDAVAPAGTNIAMLSPVGQDVPIWLYYAKRRGWSLIDSTESRAQACQLGVSGNPTEKMSAILIKDATGLHIQKCAQ